MENPRNNTPITFTDWQNVLWERYGPELQKYSSSDICLRLVEATGYIAEAVRRNRYYLIINELAKGFARLLDLYNRTANDEKNGHLFKIGNNGFQGLEASIFHKFPKRCFLCGRVHCECNILFGDTDERTRDDEEKALQEGQEALRIARINELAPKTLDDYEVMFARIYGQGHRYSNIDSINHHLMEEIGEVARAHRHLKEAIERGFAVNEQAEKKITPEECRFNFCSEIADVVSWTTALRRKADYHITRAGKAKEMPKAPTLSQLLTTLFLEKGEFNS